MTDDSTRVTTPQDRVADIGTGHRLVAFAGTNRHARGEVIEDFGPDPETAEADENAHSDPSRHWAIHTDDMLVVANADDIKVLTCE
ncbi:hypothetical protein [Jongsikchunia kroppenstedtii]|uniref:hypothetical protein n=1 Tax=Jongsikchunia kroppenstedtii TaxID=1121721 RepID=UPI0003A858E8|nr:hypothetical protein [Jongsikchunia kroppenstedtii]